MNVQGAAERISVFGKVSILEQTVNIIKISCVRS